MERRLTAQQKNKTENAANTIGRRSHPSKCKVMRNMISKGSVTNRSVSITSLALGPCESLEPVGDFSSDECKAVDSRDTKIDPTPPGRPK